MVPTLQDRIQGMFLGIAIGDALGMPVETWSPERIASEVGRVTRYLEPKGHKWFDGRPAGTTTDDTQLTLVVAESLIACKGLNMDDMAGRHCASMDFEGDRGFGGSTRDAIKRLAAGVHWSESGKAADPKRGKGNGIPMKIAPFAAYYRAFAHNIRLGHDECTIARMTHDTHMGVESAIIHVAAVRNCLSQTPDTFSRKYFTGELRQTLMDDSEPEKANADRLSDRMVILDNLRYDGLKNGDIWQMFGGGDCYVYDSLPFTYAFFLRNPFSIKCLYELVNAGGDTDTNASIAGGMLGALNGMSVFPKHLLEGLKDRDRILDVANRFYKTFFENNP